MKPPEATTRKDESQTARASSNTAETPKTVHCITAKKFSLMVVPVFVSSKEKPEVEILTYALLDTQSDTTFAVTELLEQLPVSYEKRQIQLSTMTSQNQIIDTRFYQGLQVRAYTGKKMVELPPIYTREYIPVTEAHIPTAESVEQIGHLKHIAPFIPPRLDCDVGMLIGYYCSQALLPRRVECGDDTQPFAIETDLGWSVIGAQDRNQAGSSSESHLVLSSACFKLKSTVKEIVAAKDLEILSQDFKDTERTTGQIGSSDKLFQNELKFMDIVSQSIHQNKEGCSDWMAEQRLKNMTKWLARDKDYRDKHQDFMKGLIDRGEAEPANDHSTRHRWYLPHHGVVHPKKPGKVRVVWDCSSRCEGVSLNDVLLQGLDLNNTLLGVLLRFRLGEIALSCDIEKMFFQFRVPQEQRDFLRYLWYDENGDVCDYRMKVHVFGATSSPSCAIYGLKRLADDYGQQYPQAKKFIQNHFYVDDGLVSTDSTEEAAKMAQESIEMCKKANIPVCKFKCASEEVLSQIPVSEHADENSTQELLPQISSA